MKIIILMFFILITQNTAISFFKSSCEKEVTPLECLKRSIDDFNAKAFNIEFRKMIGDKFSEYIPSPSMDFKVKRWDKNNLQQPIYFLTKINWNREPEINRIEISFNLMDDNNWDSYSNLLGKYYSEGPIINTITDYPEDKGSDMFRVRIIVIVEIRSPSSPNAIGYYTSPLILKYDQEHRDIVNSKVTEELKKKETKKKEDKKKALLKFLEPILVTGKQEEIKELKPIGANKKKDKMKEPELDSELESQKITDSIQERINETIKDIQQELKNLLKLTKEEFHKKSKEEEKKLKEKAFENIDLTIEIEKERIKDNEKREKLTKKVLEEFKTEKERLKKKALGEIKEEISKKEFDTLHSTYKKLLSNHLAFLHQILDRFKDKSNDLFIRLSTIWNEQHKEIKKLDNREIIVTIELLEDKRKSIKEEMKQLIKKFNFYLHHQSAVEFKDNEENGFE